MPKIALYLTRIRRKWSWMNWKAEMRQNSWQSLKHAKLNLTYPVRTKRLRPNEALRFLRTQSTMKRKRMSIRAQELCEEGGGLDSHSPSHSALIPSKPHGFCGCCKAPRKKKAEVQSSGAVWTGRRAWAVVTVPFFPLSLAIRLHFLWTQSTMKRKRMSVRALELCEQGGARRAWALTPHPALPLSLISCTVSVGVKHHERKKRCLSSICTAYSSYLFNMYITFSHIYVCHRGIQCIRSVFISYNEARVDQRNKVIIIRPFVIVYTDTRPPTQPPHTQDNKHGLLIVK